MSKWRTTNPAGVAPLPTQWTALPETSFEEGILPPPYILPLPTRPPTPFTTSRTLPGRYSSPFGLLLCPRQNALSMEAKKLLETQVSFGFVYGCLHLSVIFSPLPQTI